MTNGYLFFPFPFPPALLLPLPALELLVALLLALLFSEFPAPLLLPGLELLEELELDELEFEELEFDELELLLDELPPALLFSEFPAPLLLPGWSYLPPYWLCSAPEQLLFALASLTSVLKRSVT